MSDKSGRRDPAAFEEATVEARGVEVVDARRAGDDPGACAYGCGDDAEYVVQLQRGSWDPVEVAGCRSCLNRGKIYPVDNEHVEPEGRA